MAREAIEMILEGSRQKTVYAYLEKMHDKLKRKEFDEMVNGKPDMKDILREDLDTDEDFTDAEEDYNKNAISEDDEDNEFEEESETL